MREKFIKKINFLYFVYTISILIIFILFLIIKENIANKWFIIAPCFLAIIVAGGYINNYRQEWDKKYIEHSVIDGKFALAKINNAKQSMIINETLGVKNKLFELEIEIIDCNLKTIKGTIVDQFSIAQDGIPSGYVYVTFDGTLESALIIPTFIMQKYATDGETIERYENEIQNLNYLNVLYHYGLIVETFNDSLKRFDKK